LTGAGNINPVPKEPGCERSWARRLGVKVAEDITLLSTGAGGDVIGKVLPTVLSGGNKLVPISVTGTSVICSGSCKDES
jgi:hypothetical protein